MSDVVLQTHALVKRFGGITATNQEIGRAHV